MLTPKDIENPARKSGYNYVGSASAGPGGGGQTVLWRAGAGTGNTHGKSDALKPPRWRASARADPLAAAQDYCDYINARSTMLTPKDIENPARKSGYDHVNSATGGMGRQAHLAFERNQRWRASLNSGGGHNPSNPSFRGPARSTELEAAQDYCDWYNGNPSVAKVSVAYLTPTIDMGNKAFRHAPKAEKLSVKREVHVGPHDLYDVLIYDPITGEVIRRKVGITATGHARYADICKTFGFSIKPHAQAVTYPTKPDAEKAETARVQKVSKDKNWVRTGKESFAPATKGGKQC